MFPHFFDIFRECTYLGRNQLEFAFAFNKYTIDICMQMLASAEMIKMNTKDYLWGIQYWGTETKKQRKKETNKLGEN